MRVDQPYGKRYEDQEHTIEPFKKVFIACEGEQTEYKYFQGVMKYRSELSISPFIEMVPIRHDPLTGSNPLQIFAEAKQALEGSDHYFPSTDILYLIVDRDMHSFKDYQYDLLLSKCKEEGFFLAISNPCFELWLLMHYSDLSAYNLDTILTNKKIGHRTQTEIFLMDKLGGSYNKSRLKFSIQFLDRIEVAIENASKHTTSLVSLKNSIGTNVGGLIEYLQKKETMGS